MMLPKKPAAVPPKPVASSTPPPLDAVPVDADDNCPEHADYNLRPLAVHSLEHYVARDDEDERFHVS